MPDFENNRCVVMVVGAILIGIAAILVIVLPMSFATLEYHEFGFLRQKSTGSVDTSKVYSGGKYFVGPDYEFKTFNAQAHYLDLHSIAIFTRDKLEVKITAHVQYFLRKDELPLLHKAYDVYYQDVMKSSAIDALKGSIPVYKTKELISKRMEVEGVIFETIRKRLGGTCCRPDCAEYAYACMPRCIAVGKCTDKEKGLNVNVKYFQLTDISIPDDVKDRYMETLVLQEKVLREKLYQNATLIRKATDAKVEEIKNEATEIEQNARATAQKTTTVSQAEYTNTIEQARSQGLAKLYSDLGITDQKQKNSFDYLRTLRGLDNVHLTVDFQQRIAGNL